MGAKWSSLVRRLASAAEVFYGAGGSPTKFAPAAGVPDGKITAGLELQKDRSLAEVSPDCVGDSETHGGPSPVPRPLPIHPKFPPRQAGLTSRHGLGRWQQWRDRRPGGRGRPGHGPGPARLWRRPRRCFVSRAAEPAQPRESADSTEGGGGHQTVGDPKTLLLTLPNLPVTDPPPLLSLAPGLDTLDPVHTPGFATPCGPAPGTTLKGTATGLGIPSVLFRVEG